MLIAPWALFDPIWYRAQYADAPHGTDAALLEWHLTRGQAIGHSPNRYFDEEWQREAWPGIVALIEDGSVASAFDAWCRGPNATRAPHWLFDPREYRIRYPALTDDTLWEAGFVNRYHHYLSHGAAEGRIGHPLFDPAVYLASLGATDAQAAATMPFRHYLCALERGDPECRTSLLFDPEWYRVRYPEAARLVAARRYRSLLEHYLRNDRPTEFDPSPAFSEAFYLAENPGLAEAIGPTGFRNGFFHFLAHGSREFRSPHPDLDLAWYAEQDRVRADIAAGHAPDPYVHWLTIGQGSGLRGRPRPETVLTSAQAVALRQRRAEAVLPLFGRHKLDFSVTGRPAISVIMRVSNDPATAMLTLAALRAGFHREIELILILSEPTAAAADIENLLVGATVLRFAAVLDEAASREAGLICATAEAVLLLDDDIEVGPGTIDNALARLASDPTIGAVGARLIQPHGTLFEAGGIVWRDGRLWAWGRDAVATSPDANFVRDTDYCSTLLLLARRNVAAAIPDSGPGLAGTTHDAADLCARISETGYRVVYDPDVIGFIATERSEARPDGTAAFVVAHASMLARRPEFDPDAAIRARSPRADRTRVLFIEDCVPLRRIGSGFGRSNDILRAMVAAGAAITVFPMTAKPFPLSVIRDELPDTVEVMHDLTAADLAGFVAARRDCYDVVWIARAHNLNGARAALLARTPEVGAGEPRLAAAFASPGAPLPRIVVDTEAIAAVRRAEQAVLLRQDFDFTAALAEEFRQLDPEMHAVAVTEAEAALIRAHFPGEVSVLGHIGPGSPTLRRFDERSGMLFVGAIHAMDHPNYDGLIWFIDEVLPLIEQELRWETRLTVAGYTAPEVSLERFQSHPRVTLRGPVADLAPLYDSHRVFVAPARFAAGLPYKVTEAVSHGLPVVATSLLARQLGWSDDQCLLAADAGDPAGFAARVVALHRDASLWTRVREAALARAALDFGHDAFAAKVAELLAGAAR